MGGTKKKKQLQAKSEYSLIFCVYSKISNSGAVYPTEALTGTNLQILHWFLSQFIGAAFLDLETRRHCSLHMTKQVVTYIRLIVLCSELTIAE